MKRGIAMEYQKKGYLTSYFKLFHLKDVQKIEIKAHYHEFDKIIVFIILLLAIQQHMNVLSFILTLII